MNPVIQEEQYGCGIGATANILGKTYSEMKEIANAMGIFAGDELLWSDTEYVRNMLAGFGIKTSDSTTQFKSWNELPNLALLAIKHHKKNGKNFWHWVVFKRLKDKAHVLDSAFHLKSNLRTDFNRMKPKWFIEVNSA